MEKSRIQKVYAERDAKISRRRYAWYKEDVRYRHCSFERNLAKVLRNVLGDNLAGKQILDVGCGSGAFLRTLVEWGAEPEGLTGIDLLEDRIATAKKLSPPTIRFHVGDVQELRTNQRFDLVTANTVFTSILLDIERKKLASEIWERIRPGGALIVFDFRFNNPNNANVRRVTRQEIQSLWPEGRGEYRTLILAPPLGRSIAKCGALVSTLVEALLPAVRSHFIFSVRK